MKSLFFLIGSFLNFIYGFLFYYIFLWLWIAVYGVQCLVNECSDMVGEESSSIIMGLIVAVLGSAILVPILIFTNIRIRRVISIRKIYYLLFITMMFTLGFLLKLYLKLN